MWYDFAVVDGFSSNSSSILEVIFFVKISSNSTIGSMRSSCQIRHLSIQIVSSIVFSNTHFRYAAYSAIYSWTLFFFFLDTISLFLKNIQFKFDDILDSVFFSFYSILILGLYL